MVKAIRGKKLTSKEAARVLGVSEASVKRWADGGLLPMEKTAGGHRRFRPEDVAVIRRAGIVEKEPGLLKKRSAARLLARPARAAELAPGKEAQVIEETFGALMDGHDEELSALLVNLHLHGQTVGSIADSFLCPAMRRVGDLWHAGELSVGQEHVATRTATSALRQLQSVLDVPEGERTRALCCGVEDDFHELPLRIAALTLEAGGAEVFNLGMSTPFSALAEVVQRFRPELVCVSSTLLVSLDRAAREYSAFHKTARRVRARIVLGGAGFADAGVRSRLPADLHAESFRELEEFISTPATGES
ncbi:MAG TPA: B12-binding domain-containing protein [Pyrinomonadaceae bacterium]|nr:B12-binding domain-containing protein [Pyrinomonadaceae bacterium]